jgi:hypothetical protein
MALTKINNNTLSAVSELPSGISGQNYPSFFARRFNNQSVGADTDTKMLPDDVVYDTDSAFDTSTGRFTVPTGKGGKYFFTYGFQVNNLTDNRQLAVNLKVNGSFADPNGTNILNGSYAFTNAASNIGNDTDDPAVTASAILDLSAGDYVEMWGRHRAPSSENARYMRFGAYRIGD